MVSILLTFYHNIHVLSINKYIVNSKFIKYQQYLNIRINYFVKSYIDLI